MALAYSPIWAGRRRHLADLAVILWVAAWLGLGSAVSNDIGGLSVVASTMSGVGATMEQTANVLSKVGSLPFVGADVGPIAREARRTALAASSGSVTLRRSVAQLATLLGVFLAAVPVLVVLAVYIPGRISVALEVRAVRRTLRRPDPAFEEYLARRAVASLPFHALRRVSPTPWRDLDEGRFSALAEAELKRIGISRR